MEKVIESKIPGYGYKVLTAPGEKRMCIVNTAKERKNT